MAKQIKETPILYGDDAFAFLDEIGELKSVEHAGSGHTCGKCEHTVRPHYYRRDWIYCEITKSNRTQFGINKVKSRQPACDRFSPRTAQTTGE